MLPRARSASAPVLPGPEGRQPYTWLTGLIIVMTVVALAIGALALHYVETRLVATTGESLALAAAEIADNLDRFLHERHGDAQMASRALSVRFQDPSYVGRYLTWMQKAYPVYLWLGVTDARGRVVAATDPAAVGQDSSKSPWFQAVRKRDEVFVGDATPFEGAGGVEAVAFTAPIRDPRGEFLGALTTQVGLPAVEDVLTQTIRAVQAQRGFLGTIEYQFLTREGNAFIDSDLLHKGNVNLKQLGLLSAILSESSQSGSIEEMHLRRQVQVITGYAKTQGYRDFPGLQWTILVRVDRSDVLRPIREVLWKLGLAGAVVWVPMFALMLWATGRLRKAYLQTQQERERERAAEAALRESEEQTRLIVESALDAVIVMDGEGRITDWNAQAEVIFGWPRRESIGRLLSSTIIPPAHREAHESGLRRFLATGEERLLNRRIEVTALHRDGREFPAELAISPARRGHTYTFSAFVRDITERKRAEGRQAAQLAVSRALAESATLGEAAARLLQAVCDTMGWEVGAIWLVDRPAGVLRCETIWQRPKINVEEFVALSRATSFSPGIGLPGRVWASGEPAWIADVVKDTNFPRAPIAARVGLHGAFGFPIRGASEVLGVVEFFSRDIRQPDTDLLHMMADVGIKIGQFVQRQQLEGQLLQAQKMEAIGRLAGGVAHDFNNLLTVITGYCQLLLSTLAPDVPHRKEIEEIRKAGERATSLTSQLLAFSRRQVLQPAVLDLNDVVGRMDGMLRRLIGEDIALVTRLEPALGRVKADPGQLEQVIMNLAINARDAMPQGGRLTIETANVDLAEPLSRESVAVKPGRYVLLAVSDIGCGMDAETQSHLFEPFFTTKGRGKGTGLGLATVYGIIKQSGGNVWAESKPGLGTKFKMLLPRAEAPVAGSESRPVLAESSPSGSETILVVEDEGMLRSLARKILHVKGYTVLDARDGGEALRIAQEHGGVIHLLLTDVVMPGINGRELAEALARVRPDMKMLYMSGYTDDTVVHHGVMDAGIAFLQKPFTPDGLARKVREVLDGPTRG